MKKKSFVDLVTLMFLTIPFHIGFIACLDCIFTLVPYSLLDSKCVNNFKGFLKN
jgi:hypothetical protein